jgi:hypothetical protein
MYACFEVIVDANNCELRWPLEVDTWEGEGDRKKIAQREREPNPFLVLYDVKQAAEVSQRRTAVGSKCFQLYYTCSDRLLTIALPSYSFHLFSPLTVTFPKLSVILRPLYVLKVKHAEIVCESESKRLT